MVDALSILGNVLLFLLVFGMSATVDIKCMQQQIRNKNAILLGIFCQFMLLPLLGFIAVKSLNLEDSVGITLLVVTSSPGGSYSNWWCSMFNADLALSVTMTAISTLLSVITLPVNLLLYVNFAYGGKNAEEDITQVIDWGSLFLSLSVVISAIVLGLWMSKRSHSYKFNIIANKIGNIAGLGLIVFSAAVTNTGDADDSKIWERDWSFYVACAAPCILGLLISSILASLLQLKKPERMTVAIECCYQNVGIGASLALTMFNGQELNQAMGVPFFYGICEGTFVCLYCLVGWKAGWTKAPVDVPIWKMIFTSYEVLEAEESVEVSEIEVAVSMDQDSQEYEKGHVFTTFFELNDDDPKSPKEPSGEVKKSGEDPNLYPENVIT